MIDSNVKKRTAAPQLNPGDQLLGRDAEGNDATFVILSINLKSGSEGLTATYVLRQRDGWTVTVGEGALTGDEPLFRPIVSETDSAGCP